MLRRMTGQAGEAPSSPAWQAYVKAPAGLECLRDQDEIADFDLATG